MTTARSQHLISTGFDRVAWPPVVTFVLWSACIVIGVAGVVYPYSRPIPPVTEAPIQAELIDVQLNPLPASESARPQLARANPESLPAPAPAAPISRQIAEAPKLIPVAAPRAVVFAVPVEPVQIAATPAAASVTATVAEADAPSGTPAAAPSGGAPQQLTFGEGEGRQPAPEYPYRARKAGQEGVVRVRFTVGRNGRVLEAAPIARCPWRLLNEAALRVIRERWQFSQGQTRVYEVSIRFEMRKQDA